jgi:hypothetical protein
MRNTAIETADAVKWYVARSLRTKEGDAILPFAVENLSRPISSSTPSVGDFFPSTTTGLRALGREPHRAGHGMLTAGRARCIMDFVGVENVRWKVRFATGNRRVHDHPPGG